MKDLVNKKILITTNNWFYAPDGKQYRAVWGTLKAVHEAGATMGFIPNRAHANWFIEIGSLIVMGCQVMYVIQAAEKPNTDPVKDLHQVDPTSNEVKEFERPGSIWITE